MAAARRAHRGFYEDEAGPEYGQPSKIGSEGVTVRGKKLRPGDHVRFAHHTKGTATGTYIGPGGYGKGLHYVMLHGQGETGYEASRHLMVGSAAITAVKPRGLNARRDAVAQHMHDIEEHSQYADRGHFPMKPIELLDITHEAHKHLGGQHLEEHHPEIAEQLGLGGGYGGRRPRAGRGLRSARRAVPRAARHRRSRY